MVDIATRVWNHKWKIDPIVRSLIDTDFYKLLMCQSIFRNKPNTQVTFSLINRSINVRLADLVDEGELREQLEYAENGSVTLLVDMLRSSIEMAKENALAALLDFSLHDKVGGGAPAALEWVVVTDLACAFPLRAP